jgi:hypothetical protein
MCVWTTDDQILVTALAAGAALVVLAPPALLLARARGARLAAAALWLAAAALVTAASLLVEDGFTDADGTLWVRYVVAMGAATAFAFVIGVLARKRPVTLAAMALFGGAAPAVLVVAFLFAALALTGTCLD